MRPLSVEDHLSQPSEEVSPPKWHLGHTTWFFETFILRPYDSTYKIFHEQFPFLFNSYYENAGERLQRDARGFMTRPPLADIYAYRQYVDAQMEKLLRADPDSSVLELLALGINHEQQHQELFLTDFKFILGTQAFHPVYNASFVENTAEKSPSENSWIEVPHGIHHIGHQGDEFAYDNELGRHRVFLEDYAIASQLVTNGEWQDFIDAGGYENVNLWHSEGWAWRQENNITAPLYWEKQQGKWQHFTLAGLEPVNPLHSVNHISYYEAFAFAEWRGYRLPTEAEWEVAADKFSWGERWEWTNSAYLPYPGFKKAEGAVGEYNGKFMVSQMVLRGASVGTSPGHSRATYRNFFHPSTRWQFAGLRLAK